MPDELKTPARPALKSWEQWADSKKIDHWRAEAARHGRQWPIGFEVSEAAFDQALVDAFNTRIG